VLGEKRAALAEVSKTTEEEEGKLRHEREKIVHRVAKGDLAQYERIRKAKKGKAVVPVRRAACGGCFARVPPQKLLELRQNSKIYLCEHCGRIIVSDEIAVGKTSAV
jgi:predicted  nucleic acid-binding Zn-ribbon protein